MTVCHVLREDPDLADAVPRPVRPRAVETCVARTLAVATGRWSAQGGEAISGGIGLLVLDGLLLRRVGVDGRFGAELLGQGDLLRPWQGEDGSAALARTTGWRVLEPVRLAVLDEAAARRLAAYPELTGRLVERALDRSRHLAVNMAIIHQARVHMRLLMMFWHLAERWGRVRREGVFLPLALTHSVLADLVAARRPTVTTGLAELYRRELVRDLPRGWLLLGEPPGELVETREAGVARS
jgi:CRP/FNR family transcriptional regulator, cyclic AMP receptor protein